MKKIALFLVVLSILFGQNISAAVVDQRPQTAKPAYEKITVPDQDLNNTNKPILYRYKITAPKSGPLTISGETIEIQAVGVVPETINLTVFSDKDFKKQIQKNSLKFNVNLGKQKLNFAFKDPIKVKAGDTVFIQIDTAIKGNKDTAYITTKSSGLSETTLKAKPVAKVLSPIIIDVIYRPSSPMVNDWITTDVVVKNNTDKRISGSKVSVQGTLIDIPNLDPGQKTTVTALNAFSFSTPGTHELKTVIIGSDNNSYDVFTNTITFKERKNPTIQVISPNGGDAFDVNGIIKIKGEVSGVKSGTKINAYLYHPELGDVRSVSTIVSDSGSIVVDMGLSKGGTDIGEYKITLCAEGYQNEQGKDLCDQSDAYFKVTQETTSNMCSFSRNLTLGSSGDDVANLQYFLQTKGFLGTTGEDKGYFGAATKAALAKYQNSIGISPADGYFSALTRARLFEDCISTQGVLVRNIFSTANSIYSGDKAIGAEYKFSFDLTSLEKEIFINRTANLFDIWSGVTYEVLDQGGIPVKRGTFHTSSVIIAQVDQLADYFILREGVTKKFSPEIIIDNLEKDGFYQIKLMNLGYLNAPTSTPPFFEIPLNYESNFMYISANRPVTSKASPSIQASEINTFQFKDFEKGMKHADIIKVQKFLNNNGYLIESITGEPGSKGYESDYFGEKTKQALIKFQKDKGITPAQGYFGPKTRAVMGI